ncbi:MAG: LuxR C-terminal-related transcriptional regulator, partial [Syntrophobacteraceae bacterium]
MKACKRNKEIASILGISLNTVMTHRYRLRSKLGLKQ